MRDRIDEDGGEADGESKEEKRDGGDLGDGRDAETEGEERIAPVQFGWRAGERQGEIVEGCREVFGRDGSG
ncbi:MAG: hypothetical protein A2Y36_18870 [Treponema sp. GWA1_62_8]|nr:MAG: hypothetical protein A2Y36_18870 [Treponema sp. GWA1_62_8]